jgi:tetratricopeptide (TPR) repeat protein
VTTASDVYGLGSTLYALLAGRAPFEGSSLAETLDMVRGLTPEPPSRLNRRVPRDLEVICLKCLEKDPKHRYDSAQALADDLNRWLDGEPILARPVGPLTRAWLWCRRHPLPAALAAGLALAVVAGFAGVTWKWREADRERATGLKIIGTYQAMLVQAPAEVLHRAAAQLGGEYEALPEVNAAVRETLGEGFRAQGLYEYAEPQLRDAVALATKHYGPGHRSTLGATDRLVALLDEAGRGAEAERLARRNLGACRRSLGADDPTTLAAADTLGVVLWHLKKTDETEGQLRLALAARRRVLGSGHPDTLRSVNNLGRLLQDRGRFDEANALFLEYEKGVRCIGGTKNPDNVVALTNLGLLRLNQGNLGEAETYHRRAAEEARRILGPGHPKTLAAEARLARLLRDLERGQGSRQASPE